MKYILSTLWFVLILSSTCLAGVEYVTEEVCHNMSGCRINIETGECLECVIGKREVIHTHEETFIEKKKPVVKTTPRKRSTGKRKWRCIVEPCDWIDENGNLKS